MISLATLFDGCVCVAFIVLGFIVVALLLAKLLK